MSAGQAASGRLFIAGHPEGKFWVCQDLPSGSVLAFGGTAPGKTRQTQAHPTGYGAKTFPKKVTSSGYTDFGQSIRTSRDLTPEELYALGDIAGKTDSSVKAAAISTLIELLDAPVFVDFPGEIFAHADALAPTNLRRTLAAAAESWRGRKQAEERVGKKPSTSKSDAQAPDWREGAAKDVQGDAANAAWAW